MASETPSAWKQVARRWRTIGYAVVLALLFVIVLQNLEPTRLDLLFWSVAEVPKLVLVLGSMATGVVLWELGRLLVSGSRRSHER